MHYIGKLDEVVFLNEVSCDFFFKFLSEVDLYSNFFITINANGENLFVIQPLQVDF